MARRILTDKGIKCSAMDYSLLSHCYMALPKILLLFAEIPVDKRTPAVNDAIKLISEKMIDNEIFVYVPSTRRGWQKVLDHSPKRADLPAGQTVKMWTMDQKEEYLQQHGLGLRKPKPGWPKFGFPLHYNSDILEAMYALALLETPMIPKLKKAIEIIQNKRTPTGKWCMENSLNGKMWAAVEEKGKPSKWITYFALYVLNHFRI